MKNWKTFSAGILSIVGGLTGLYFGYKDGGLTAEEISIASVAIVTGVGLLLAKDGDVTGVGTQARSKSDLGIK